MIDLIKQDSDVTDVDARGDENYLMADNIFSDNINNSPNTYVVNHLNSSEKNHSIKKGLIEEL
jgi:hypothetical protein